MPWKWVDLEELAKKHGWTWRHADKIMLARDAVVVVEETSRAKLDDVKKLEETVEKLRKGELGRALGLAREPRLVVAVLHAKKTDTPVYWALMRRTRRRTVYMAAGCREGLRNILEKYARDP